MIGKYQFKALWMGRPAHFSLLNHVMFTDNWQSLFTFILETVTLFADTTWWDCDIEAKQNCPCIACEWRLNIICRRPTIEPPAAAPAVRASQRQPYLNKMCRGIIMAVDYDFTHISAILKPLNCFISSFLHRRGLCIWLALSILTGRQYYSETTN